MIRVTGYDFSSAPEVLRASLCYSPEEMQRLDRKLFSALRPHALLLLLTCSRIEVWSEGATSFAPDIIAKCLAHHPLSLLPWRYEISADEAISHLFDLSTGILSPYFGEETIISQIVRAMDSSRTSGTMDSTFELLFRSAVTHAKAIHSRMVVRVFDQEITDAVCNLVRDKEVFIIGTGVLARSIATALHEDGHIVFQTIRDMHKVDLLIPPGVHALSYDERLAHLSSFHTIISASSGIGYTVSDPALLSGKFLFDLAMPTDFPPGIGAIGLDNLLLRMPRRDAMKALVHSLGLQAMQSYKAEEAKRLAYKGAEVHAYDARMALMRQLASTLDGLNLEEKDKKNLAASIF